MRNLLLLMTTFFLLTACYNPPSTEELVAKYSAAPEAFESFKKMIIEDTEQHQCFDTESSIVEWAPNITLKRAEKYKLLFVSTGAKTIYFCHSANYLHIKVHSDERCTAFIDWSNKTLLPASVGERGRRNFKEITPLNNGWYLIVYCT